MIKQHPEVASLEINRAGRFAGLDYDILVLYKFKKELDIKGLHAVLHGAALEKFEPWAEEEDVWKMRVGRIG